MAKVRLEAFIKDRKDKLTDFKQVLIDFSHEPETVVATNLLIKDFEYQLEVLDIINAQL